jgi:polyribonucleotide nucleotidyltransferase
MAAASSNQTLTLHIPKSKQALIVGKGGATIKALQDEYGCRIALPPADNASREVTIRGPHAAVAQLCSRLESVIGLRVGTAPLSIGRFSVPCATHGVLVGKAGAKLRELEQRFNVEISIPRREANVDEVCAEGESAQLKLLQVELSALVLRNVSLVIEAIYASASDDAPPNEASLPRSLSTAPLPYRDLLLQVPRGKHSLIIGKGGATIRSLQDEFSCQVTISGGEQSASRQVKISGTATNVSAAQYAYFLCVTTLFQSP